MSISLSYSTVTNAELASLQQLPNTQTLLPRNTRVNDEGLAHLKSMRALQ